MKNNGVTKKMIEVAENILKGEVSEETESLDEARWKKTSKSTAQLYNGATVQIEKIKGGKWEEEHYKGVLEAKSRVDHLQKSPQKYEYVGMVYLRNGQVITYISDGKNVADPYDDSPISNYQGDEYDDY